jgi:hypothetical protein
VRLSAEVHVSLSSSSVAVQSLQGPWPSRILRFRNLFKTHGRTPLDKWCFFITNIKLLLILPMLILKLA